MEDFENKIQALMDEFYFDWKENNGKSKWDVLEGFSPAHQIAVVFGNFNYQVGNGGIAQWIYNGYFHDDADKLARYLEVGAQFDARCQLILDRISKLNQHAQETECGRRGHFYDEYGGIQFIGDVIDCDAFNTWYYANCDGENWWQIVCGIIDKAEEREAVPPGHEKHGGVSQRHPIQVFIGNVHDESIGGFTIPLPSKLEELQGFLEAAEITGWPDMEILEVTSDTPGLGELLTEVTLKTMSPVMLDELNYLAAKIRDIHPSERELFAAAIEVKAHCNTVAEIINLTDNLSGFNLEPAFDATMLGEHLLDGDADKFAAGLQQLYDSKDERLREVIGYIEVLEKYFNHTAYGKEYAEDEHGFFTENGYFSGPGELKLVYRGPVDIPDEHRIFTEPGVTYRYPMKLDGENIAETLVKIHALCCVNMNGAAEELKLVSQGRDSDYLLLVNRERVFLTPAIDAYKRGDTAEGTIKSWAQVPGTSIFALRVMDFGDDDGRGSVGDFVELNIEALLSNISRHAVTPECVEAFKRDGFSKSFDFAQWEALSKTPQYDIERFTAHFSRQALNTAERRYESFMGANEMSSEAVGTDTFLTVMIAANMAAAENPQPDMLRISNDAAKQIITRGDADVFKLTPNGAVKLTPVDAMRQLSFAQLSELAIKRENLPEIDKWAGRTADSLLLQGERGEPDKSKQDERYDI